MNSNCTIYIVRHGETEWNKKSLIQGHLDSPLTPKGIKQAHQAKETLKNIRFDEMFSSDLGRAVNTAKVINLGRKLAIKTTKRLRERDYGEQAGKKYNVFQTELKEYFKEFEALSIEGKWKYKYPTMESDEELTSRFIQFLREVAVGYPYKTVLIVTHAGMIGNLLVHLGVWGYDQRFKKEIGNAGFIKLESDGVDFFVKDGVGIKI